MLTSSLRRLRRRRGQFSLGGSGPSGPCGCCTAPPNCGACALTFPMTLTDSHTSLTLPAANSGVICYLLPVASAVTPCDCWNSRAPAGAGAILITYHVVFQDAGGGACQVTINRGWSFCLSGWASGTGPAAFYYCVDTYTGCIATTQSCTLTSPPNPVPSTTTTQCHDSGIDGGAGCNDNFTGNLPNCTPPWSFTMTNCSPDGILPSPLSATVTIG